MLLLVDVSFKYCIHLLTRDQEYTYGPFSSYFIGVILLYLEYSN